MFGRSLSRDVLSWIDEGVETWKLLQYVLKIKLSQVKFTEC